MLVGSLAAQNGSKRVDLKEITDGQFRQVTNIGEMRSMPDGEHYTAMNDARNMIIKYSYRTGNPSILYSIQRKRVSVRLTSSTDTRLAVPDTIFLYGAIRNRSIARSFKRMCMTTMCAVIYVKPISDSKRQADDFPTFSPDGEDGRLCK